MSHFISVRDRKRINYTYPERLLLTFYVFNIFYFFTKLERFEAKAK